ncbi:hypothetical protein PR002_g4713 [Phytophthora rubi]|uniref:DDE-1 domain-containing protein n=1 Tax=Phytophthora rubi TaxID=129364 RepID=A0A6A3NH33_9STRA|nr:hypothetical protein PR002_g4713 [Phytophthora rubi]
MDETAFVYRREQRGSLTVDKKEKGKKQSKQRITVCLATNADGTDRLPLHFIRKSKVPISLRNRDVLAEIGATYTNTAKAWMKTVKYCEWLLELNERMRQEGRHILLLVDNVSSHDDDPVQLSNVVIHKLPPNTTAALQPMDQRIIKSLKDEYKEKKEDAKLDMFYSGVAYKSVDIFSAMKWLSEGWGDISTKTIRNCWCHTGTVSKMDMGYLLN